MAIKNSSPVSGLATQEQIDAWKCVPEAVDIKTDVVVVGGGISGVASAIAAARRSVDVVLIEPTHRVGGQATSAGVSAADVTSHFSGALEHYGIWGEIFRRVLEIYENELNVAVNTSRYREDSFGPNVVIFERVLTEMLREAGVRVLRNAVPRDARVNGETVAVSGAWGQVVGALAVDATEDGWLTKALSADYRLGNMVVSGTSQPSVEELAEAMVQDITQTAVIKRFGSIEEIPDWARFEKEPPRYEEFRANISRAYPNSPGHGRIHDNGFAGYRAVADPGSGVSYTGTEWEKITKTSLNYANDVEINASYFEDEEYAESRRIDAILKTLAIVYYLQVELKLPWALAGDEGYADGPHPRKFPDILADLEPMLQHLPLYPYVREARRGIGHATLSGKHIFRIGPFSMAPWNVEAVAIGTYPADLHGGRRAEDLEAYIGEGASDKPRHWREGPFGIPAGALMSATCPRLIFAEKNISATRIANGAARVHPTVTAIGEAAGVMAALAVRNNALPAEVPTGAIQIELIRGGALLAPATIEGIDFEDPDYLPIAVSVCRKLADWAYDPGSKNSRKPGVRVDRRLATWLGLSFVHAYEKWRLA